MAAPTATLIECVSLAVQVGGGEGAGGINPDPMSYKTVEQ